MRGSRRVAWPTILFAVLILAVATVLVMRSVRTEQVQILEASGRPETSMLSIGIASCNEGPTIEVTESDAEIRLVAAVPWRGPLASRNSCSDAAQVRLAAPLGDRHVVDGSTGQPVAITPGD